MAELQTPGPLVDTYQLYIDGRWVDPQDGRYDDIDPATEQTIATAPDASVAQVGEAIAAARRALTRDRGPMRAPKTAPATSISSATRWASMRTSSSRSRRSSGAASRMNA